MSLIRLATYAIVGYAAYAIISDIMQSRSGSTMGRGGEGRGQGRRRTRGGAGAGTAARMSGPAGEQGGRTERTEAPDGGSTAHRVGRGVVGT
jgi:hypothetical protein